MSIMYKKQSAFTIVELLIVIVVIAILAAISIVAYRGIQQRARDSERKADIATLAKALEMYKAENGVYPMTGGWCTHISNPSSGYDVAFRNALSPYIASVPYDPIYKATANDYFYRRLSSGNSYELLVQMEADTNGTYNTGGCTVIGGSQVTYNYAYTK